jgi:replication factor C subunit 3/5
LRLTKGDMRRALNILQSAHAAFPHIGENEIYACTGQPLPSDIESIITWLLEEDFSDAYKSTASVGVNL